jgi:hypothetical protein
MCGKQYDYDYYCAWIGKSVSNEECSYFRKTEMRVNFSEFPDYADTAEKDNG